jgi:signal peptidase II
LGIALGVAAVVLVADVVSKVIVVAKLAHRPAVHVIDGVLELTLTRNPGAAFSIGVGATVIFTLVAVAVVVVIARTAARLRSVPWAIALGLLLGGALGNLVDRVFRSPGPFRGEVVDWIRIPHWPVFNLADAAITVGAVLAVLLSLRGRQLDGGE